MCSMRVGIPTEVKEDESRVAITPSGVAAFSMDNHEVFVQSGAGTGSAIPDSAYRKAGATMVESAAEVWEQADLILKVKEPLAGELGLVRSGQILFTYLHLAASKSSGLKCAKHSPRNGQSVSVLRQRAVRTSALSFAKQSSMGLRSGL